MDFVKPAWIPEDNFIQKTNIAKFMQKKNLQNYNDFHRWSVENYCDFWQEVINQLKINFDTEYSALIDLSQGVEIPKWFPGAKLNIINSCFQTDKNAVAIISQKETGDITKMTYGELDELSNRVASSLISRLKKNDNVAIIMPMTHFAVAIYLGVIKAGCTAVAIPDSFSAEEIAVRLKIADVKAVFCQDEIIRDGKNLPLYKKIIQANAPFIIVLPAETTISSNLRKQDIGWTTFIEAQSTVASFTPVSCDPQDHINILFSSGTTGEPKAIPWDHTTPIKCASDAYFHQNIQPGDIFCWPTNLGWMMGPWLIFACLINHATIALYEGVPNGKNFGKFIQDTKVTILGVVPTMVRTWRASQCMENLDWDAIKLFTSTGERSSADDMLYLMQLANNKPVIEYCGGTEIGGAYITGTVVQPAVPAAFTTPALGLDFVILDEHGKIADTGEVALVPPSLGLSTELLNKNHHQVYYENMPRIDGKVLRRHGDQIERRVDGFYRLLGRVDDTMKLGGIKISSAEIEAVLNQLSSVYETAAIAVNPVNGGPSLLVIYAVLKAKEANLEQLKIDMQSAIKQYLNPLFKIHDVVIVDQLPRTASNKVMRRVLRDEYTKK